MTLGDQTLTRQSSLKEKIWVLRHAVEYKKNIRQAFRVGFLK